MFITEEKIQGKTKGIFILPTDAKKIGILFQKVSMRLCGLASRVLCFSKDVNIKVALSSLQFNIIELVLVA